MGVLDSIGEFASGVNQGVGRGMDLYSQYQQIEEQGAKRQKTKLMEDYIANLAKEGGFKDKAAAMDKLASYAAEIGDYENYDKFYQQGVGLRKAKTFNEGAKFISVLNTASDPSSAIPILNNFYKMQGLDTQYEIRPGLKGEFEIVSNTGGKVSAKKYKDVDQAKYDLMNAVEPFMFDSPGDYLENEREQMKAQAAAGKDRAAGALDMVKAAQEPANSEAQRKRDEAAAASSLASANKANVDARLAEPLANSTIATNQARAGMYKTGAEANISSIVDDNFADSEPPLPGETIPPASNPTLIKQLSGAIANNNGFGANEAIGMAQTILSGNEDFVYLKDTGELVVNGQPIKVPRAVAETIGAALKQYDDAMAGTAE
jgi:hypothetical protein